MIDPCVTNIRAYDWPSLALAGRSAAREAEHQRQQAAEILDLVGDEHPGTRREASRRLAHAAAQHLDLRRLAHIADLLERHPCLVEAAVAVEAGGRVTVEQPARPRGAQEGRPGRMSVARALTSGLRAGLGPVVAGRPA
ncbi:hypothetical protein [Methylobacterium aquaticum]|uniref:Uncharacterized protein n=1 Tax=Methylobacterium aquaticum TaxID=270351 RepID=A0A0J6S4H0_9HYPH|nr:hypothetical protein [Methylobacterium aquaticum]KMO28554.1 hypothetical protein VP06_27145 [Methylobacterium aquaticum]